MAPERPDQTLRDALRRLGENGARAERFLASAAEHLGSDAPPTTQHAAYAVREAFMSKRKGDGLAELVGAPAGEEDPARVRLDHLDRLRPGSHEGSRHYALISRFAGRAHSRQSCTNPRPVLPLPSLDCASGAAVEQNAPPRPRSGLRRRRTMGSRVLHSVCVCPSATSASSRTGMICAAGRWSRRSVQRRYSGADDYDRCEGEDERDAQGDSRPTHPV